jgi:hypothetical protein
MMQVEMVNYHKVEQTLYVVVDLEYEHGQIGREIVQARLPATGKSRSYCPPYSDLVGLTEYAQDAMPVPLGGHQRTQQER